LAKAFSLLEQTLENRMAKLAPDHFETFTSTSNLAAAYERAPGFAKAETLGRDLLKAYRKQWEPNQTQTACALVILGCTLVQQHNGPRPKRRCRN
jgi:hypothetical protein